MLLLKPAKIESMMMLKMLRITVTFRTENSSHG